MTTDYQMPLFSHYDLMVEFDHRRDDIEQSIIGDVNIFRPKSVEARLEELCCRAEICSLELRLNRQTMTVEKGGILEGTGEQHFCYTAYIPFAGDEQLWQLRPGGFAGLAPDGEIFRRELILATSASSQGEGEQQIAESLERVQQAIAIQRGRIDEFHATLPHFIEARLKRVSAQRSQRCH